MKCKFLLIAACLAFSAQVSAQVSEADFAALKAFYEATGGPNWTNNTGWDFSAGAASVKTFNKDAGEGWYGITVRKDGRVERIELRENNLNGTIPDEFYSMEILRVVVLAKNNLSGTISPKIGNLTRLVTLELGYNQLTGTIPVEIVRMGQIGSIYPPNPEGRGATHVLLSLRNNRLTGEIPANIGDMAVFQKTAYSSRIDLSNNQLTGEIPAAITKLTGLTALILSNNKLTGEVPAGIAELPALKTLMLGSGNKFTGNVPSKK